MSEGSPLPAWPGNGGHVTSPQSDPGRTSIKPVVMPGVHINFAGARSHTASLFSSHSLACKWRQMGSADHVCGGRAKLTACGPGSKHSCSPCEHQPRLGARLGSFYHNKQ